MRATYRPINRGEKHDTMRFVTGTDEGKYQERWEGGGKGKD
jgi:hypothetical protein